MKISIVMPLIICSISGFCQGRAQEISGIKEIYKVIDTLTRDNTSVTLQVSWMDSLIEIRKTVSLKYDLANMRRFRHDSTFVPTAPDTLRYNELRRIGSQNCHSYALEKYFEYHHIKDDELFTSMTILTENKFMDDMMATAFEKVSSIKTKPKRNLKHPFTKGTLLVFRNKENTPIHSVFYDGEFHTKYGAWGPKAEKELKPILDKYWDSTIIEEFQLDAGKVAKYLNRGMD